MDINPLSAKSCTLAEVYLSKLSQEFYQNYSCDNKGHTNTQILNTSATQCVWPM